MTASAKLLGDVMIPGIERVAIHRMMMGLRLFPFDATEENWFETAIQANYPGQINGKAVWWRKKHEDGTFTYTNVDPGEFRDKAPEGDAIVVDMPEAPGTHECRDLLTNALRRAERSLLADQYYRDLVRTGKALLERPEELARQAAARVEAIIPLMSSAEEENVAAPLGKLYYHCHSCLELDQITFANVLLLLQLQRMNNLWIEDRWVAEPTEYLSAFVEQLAADGNTRARLADTCSEIAFYEYGRARTALREALEADTLATMSNRLSDAQLGFLMVNALQIKGSAHGLSFKLPRPPVVVEESSACAITGVGYFARVLARHPEDIPAHLRDKAAEEGIDEFQAARQWGATPLRPVVNRKFAEILGAHAMTLASEEGKVRAGLQALLDLRSGFSKDSHGLQDDAFETGWIDQARLSAYKKLGMEEEVKRVATSMVGKLVTSRFLAEGKRARGGEA